MFLLCLVVTYTFYYSVCICIYHIPNSRSPFIVWWMHNQLNIWMYIFVHMCMSVPVPWPYMSSSHGMGDCTCLPGCFRPYPVKQECLCGTFQVEIGCQSPEKVIWLITTSLKGKDAFYEKHQLTQHRQDGFYWSSSVAHRAELYHSHFVVTKRGCHRGSGVVGLSCHYSWPVRWAPTSL